MSQFYVERDRPIFLPEFMAKEATDEMNTLLKILDPIL